MSANPRETRDLSLTAASVGLQAQLRSGAAGFAPAAAAWLAEGTALFEALGQQGRRAELARLESAFELADRGIDVRTRSRVSSHRRTFTRAAAGAIFDSALAEGRAALDEVEARVEAARKTVGALLLQGLRLGVVDDARLRASVTQEGATATWRLLAGTEELRLAARQLLLEVVEADAALLISAAARRLRSSHAPSRSPFTTAPATAGLATAHS